VGYNPYRRFHAGRADYAALAAAVLVAVVLVVWALLG
jgi:energy-coupling factor transporter transmembrane protein EcfT